MRSAALAVQHRSRMRVDKAVANSDLGKAAKCSCRTEQALEFRATCKILKVCILIVIYVS